MRRVFNQEFTEMNRTAAVVVTYNRKALLEENIHALLSQEGCELDVLVIDNASTDGTGELVRSICDQHQNVIYINTGSNLGGAGGFHFGIKKAMETGRYKYIWIMDDDCIPTATALEELLGVASELKDQFGFLSSKVLWKDNSICSMNVPRETVFKSMKDFSKDLVKVEMASFVSLFIKTETVKELGLPIKEFFIWTDDWEFTRRISLKYECYWENKSVVIHKSASNIGANIYSDSFERLSRYNYLYRNDVYLYRREGIKGFGYEAIRLIWHSLKVLTSAKDHKKERLKIIITGTKEGLSFDPSVEYVDNEAAAH